MKKIFTIISLLLICQLSFSQNQYIEPNGTIYDSSGAPIPFAKVKIQYVEYDANGPAFGYIAYEVNIQADANGIYYDSAIMDVNDYIHVGAVNCNGDTIYGPYQQVNQGQVSYVQDITVCVPTVTCSVSFSHTVNGNVGTFNVNAAPPGGIYQWDIAGNYYQGTSVSHTFTGPGLYSACVTYSTFACSAVACDTVQIVSSPSGLDLAGEVFKSNVWAESGLAFLFTLDSNSTSTNWIALDTVALDSGYYYFNNLTTGTYTVQAMLDPNDPDFLDYFPTYYGDVINWGAADSILLTANSFQNNINLESSNSAPQGAGNIIGSVVEGPNKASGPGDPIKDVIVHLRDLNGNPLDYDLTDANGDFSFDNIAFDTYQLKLEIVNENMNPEIISLNATEPSSNTIFEYDTLGIRVVLGFENELAIKTALFPNPASEILTIDLSNAQIDKAEIRINNIQGHTVIHEQIESGKSQMNIETLNAGVYFIQISSDKGRFTKKFVVQ